MTSPSCRRTCLVITWSGIWWWRLVEARERREVARLTLGLRPRFFTAETYVVADRHSSHTCINCPSYHGSTSNVDEPVSWVRNNFGSLAALPQHYSVSLVVARVGGELQEPSPPRRPDEGDRPRLDGKDCRIQAILNESRRCERFPAGPYPQVPIGLLPSPSWQDFPEQWWG